MRVLFELIAASFYVAFVQNLVFNGGYGISEAVRMSAKPRKLIPLAVFMTYFSVAVSAVCAALELLPKFHAKSELFHVAVFFSGGICRLHFYNGGSSDLRQSSAENNTKNKYCRV